MRREGEAWEKEDILLNRRQTWHRSLSGQGEKMGRLTFLEGNGELSLRDGREGNVTIVGSSRQGILHRMGRILAAESQWGKDAIRRRENGNH